MGHLNNLDNPHGVEVISAGCFITFRKMNHPENEIDSFGLVIDATEQFFDVACGESYDTVNIAEVKSVSPATFTSIKLAESHYKIY